jgi:hypothetical protein
MELVVAHYGRFGLPSGQLPTLYGLLVKKAKNWDSPSLSTEYCTAGWFGAFFSIQARDRCRGKSGTCLCLLAFRFQRQ